MEIQQKDRRQKQTVERDMSRDFLKGHLVNRCLLNVQCNDGISDVTTLDIWHIFLANNIEKENCHNLLSYTFDTLKCSNPVKNH